MNARKLEPKYKILIVDDYEESCISLMHILNDDFFCQYTTNSEKATSLVLAFRPDIILIDYRMPQMDGAELLHNLRQLVETKNIPVLFLSAVATVDEKVRALELGADDFMMKPFNVRELILRINARIQNSKRPQVTIGADEIILKNLRINLASRRIFLNNLEVFFTPKQFEMLKLLAQKRNSIVSREDFLSVIWINSAANARNVDSQINYIKKKLESFEGQIKSVHGFGYRLDVD